VVLFYRGAWQQVSIPIPGWITIIPLNKRQQSSELYGVYQASILCWELHILEPTLVLDSVSAFGTLIKGSTTITYPRAKILSRLQTWVLRNLFRAYLLLCNTRFHPGDVPSRQPTVMSLASPAVKAKLQHIRVTPSLLTTCPVAYDPDLSHGAWSTPEWMRKLILRSPIPPTWDLFADQTNSLCKDYCSLQQPFTETVFNKEAVFFFQPPYELLTTTWNQTHSAFNMLNPLQLWGLVPLAFYMQVLQPSLCEVHCCHNQCRVNYNHHSLPTSSGALFKSVLFFLSHTQCVCQYLHRVFPVCA